jgi:hypothetical protein
MFLLSSVRPFSPLVFRALKKFSSEYYGGSDFSVLMPEIKLALKRGLLSTQQPQQSPLAPATAGTVAKAKRFLRARI